MGNYSGKLSSSSNDENQKPKASTCNESFNLEKHTTPPVQRKLIIDPRSATCGIPRTPIEVNNLLEVNAMPSGLHKRVSAIPKYLQKKPYLETDIDVVMRPLSPNKCSGGSQILCEPQTPTLVKPDSTTDALNNLHLDEPVTSIDEERCKILGLDPRSPAADFDRTPILLPRSMKHLRACSHENLSKRDIYDRDMFNPRFSYCETVTSCNIQEIQIVPCIEKYLDIENADVTGINDESDSFFSSNNSSVDAMSENDDEITVIRNPKLRSSEAISNAADLALSISVCTNAKEESLRLAAENTSEELKKIDSSYSKQNHDIISVLKNNDRIQIWDDSMLSTTEQESIMKEIDNIKIFEQTSSEVPKEEIIILFDDDTVVKNNGKTENQNNNRQNPSAMGKKKKVLKTDMKLLTDQNKFFSPETKKGADLFKSRTPLGNRSNNGHIQTVATKSPQQLLRNKAISIKEQQENTPPHKKSIGKINVIGTKWDPDSTIII